MKKVLLVLFGIFVAFAAIIAAVFMLTSGAAGVANDFFTHIKSGDEDQAWSLCSQEFKKNTDRAGMLAFLKNKNLTEVADTTWSSRSITGSTAEVKGTAETASGSVIPLKVDLVKEGKSWRIQYIGLDATGVKSEQAGTAPEPSSEAEQIALVEESMKAFAESINAKDFNIFHAGISKTWLDQGITVEQLNEAFVAFIENDIDMLPAIEQLTPAFDNEPQVNDNGVMTIKGHYPSTPTKVLFELGYIKEGTSWKVVRTAVNLD